MSAFRDATGRRGPSTWEAGSYAAGEDDHPVSGISWYEAAAYCAFAGKTLPTIFHWFRAIGQDQFSDILNHSNVNAQGKAAVGTFKGLGGYGTYDMAGNVKEWTWNASGDTRYILGGAWNEPTYLFRHLIAQDPWGRDETYGMRCAKYPETSRRAADRAGDANAGVRDPRADHRRRIRAPAGHVRVRSGLRSILKSCA